MLNNTAKRILKGFCLKAQGCPQSGLPWVKCTYGLQPQRGCATLDTMDTTPLGLLNSLNPFPRVALRATLGFETKCLQDLFIHPKLAGRRFVPFDLGGTGYQPVLTGSLPVSGRVLAANYHQRRAGCPFHPPAWQRRPVAIYCRSRRSEALIKDNNK